MFFAWSGSKDLDAIQHVGIVEKVNGSTIRTIEANTDGIHLKRKTRDTDSVVGYGYPGKVKVVGKELPSERPATNRDYLPKHAAQAPGIQGVKPEPVGELTVTCHAEPAKPDTPVVTQDTVLGGLVGVAVVGAVAVSAGKAAAARVPTEAPVRIRKRGKHHRMPVSLPVDMTTGDLDEAEARTIPMPTISADVAAEAEDQEFWSRISTLADDQELAFWDSLHAELGPLATSRRSSGAGDSLPNGVEQPM